METPPAPSLASVNGKADPGLFIMPLIEISEKKHYVYSVHHPVTNELLYVGCTSNFKERSKQHRYSNVDKGNKYSQYIISLHKEGLRPKIKILGIYHDYKFARLMEKSFIKSMSPKYNTIHNV